MKIRVPRIHSLLTAICLGILSSYPSPSDASSPRQKHRINLEWKYHRGDLDSPPIRNAFNDSNWEDAVLPHTYKLTSINLDDNSDKSDQPTFHRDISWYRRTIKPEFTPGQRVFLEFEGAHQKTELWVNGTYAGEHATSAYTPFHFDITELVLPNQENTISLKLDNRKTDQIPPDGHIWDFVLFGGLYRDVYLVVKDPLHLTFPWEKREAGVAITTPSVSKRNATVSIRSTVRNQSTYVRNFTVVNRIINAGNVVVKKLEKQATAAPGSDTTLITTGGIDENLRLWSPNDPYLYRVNTQIISDGLIVDSVDNPLGFRWFEHRLGEGFLLNGDPLKLIGTNRHQQYPYIGDAVPNNLHRSDAIKIKEAGMNIVRLAHYPHDDSFLDACDELGILIAEEPPSWMELGPKIWMDRLEESTRVMIRNHRNHPSVWGWGAGINHRGPVKRLHYAAKEEDPYRVTMNNGTVWTGQQHSGITDLYAVMAYKNPDRPEGELMFAMEHSGSIDTRETEEFMNRYMGDPNRIGTALWSAHDNYSFKKRGGKYTNLSRWSAATWDAFRLPKPNYFWYKAQLSTEPMVRIGDYRAQKEDEIIIFSNCDSVELFHNGKSLGARTAERHSKNEHIPAPSIIYPFAWKDGILEVKGYVDGEAVATHSVRKPGEPHQIDLQFDTDGFHGYADGTSIVMAYARVLDKNKQIIDADTPLVSFDIDGPAEIVGDNTIGANPVTWENGVAPVLIRIGRSAGTITLKASSDGLKPDQAKLDISGPEHAPSLTAKPFFEPLRLRVDFGNIQQHIEDEWLAWTDGAPDTEERTIRGNWTAWTEGRKDVSKKSFTSNIGLKIEATISGNGTPLNWTHNWGMPGDLCFMAEDSVSTEANGGEISLKLKNLPQGTYQIKTWHHIANRGDAEVPTLQIKSSDAVHNSKVRHAAFLPSYGSAIKVSSAGIGGKGDGNSNKAASTFALTEIVSNGRDAITLYLSANETSGTISLCGFDLTQTKSE
ncbi:glycoside hydrolase family 2 protein [Pelagicoccus mobilis]|uniref:DUF4982 domain-containing protein n=1 Tax=Pelagicoccus mobilis TaxID=415221 RepID=A0A934VPA9_9BACT|nr:glycoside hydrolase family 2 TIM barrel-domain containing protein [Pelagicoccus mobilis]MBK1875630.1 DUF4982 domain-containing protein [Pelagicoccus mobilis]